MPKTKISVSNRSAEEKKYAALREEMLEDVTAQEVANAPFVFSERQTITTALTRIDLFRQILEVQGAVVECGVHKGNSLFLYNHLSTILEPYNFNRKIIGFDTFEGFRSISSNDQDKLNEADFSDANVNLLSSWVDLQDKNRPVSHIEKMELIQGDATKTIPEYVAQNPHLIIAMLYIDFDIYEPTKVALEHLLPLVPKGGIVGLDEINCKIFQGETIALKEVLSINDLRLQKFFYDPWVSYFVVE
jgi:hypothetical protein